jgi:hypothetical protein
MGYVVLILITLVLLGFLLAAMARSSSKQPRGTLRSDTPVVRDQPSADEPTPGSSAIASSQQKEQARRHVPPA